MSYRIPRRCTEEKPGQQNGESKELSYFRGIDAYVLLGDPGSGKTTLFKEEAEATAGKYITARDFLAFNRLKEWQNVTLYIDGLDETRAGKEDGRTPLDAIRAKLDQLGCPRFRISCRAADWLGGNDQGALNACSPNGKVEVLRLEGLDIDDVKLFLKNLNIQNPEEFIQTAIKYGLEGLLHNPQSLKMIVSAVDTGGKWPTTKLETYQLATTKLAQEQNSEHIAASGKSKQKIENLLDAAGFLYSILLLANATKLNVVGDDQDDQVSLSLLDIPNQLPCDEVLKTGLFKSTGEGKFQAVHRSVAEYLGARYLDKRIKEGLPLKRVLALMTGFDGGVVAALRGLLAWLSAHSIEARSHLIEIDPLGVVLYGDSHLFSTEAKKQLLIALHTEAEKSGFLNYDRWANESFSALITKDILDQILLLLRSESRAKPDQILLNCILDGLSSSEKIIEVKDDLLRIVSDESYWEGVRASALDALIYQSDTDKECLVKLANDIKNGKIEDGNNRLLGDLLVELFPEHIKPKVILSYLKRPDSRLISNYDIFWDHKLIESLKDEDIPLLLDDFATRDKSFLQITPVNDLYKLTGNLIVRGLTLIGNSITNERLYNWLSLGLDEYSHSRLEKETESEIRKWFEKNITNYLGVLEEGLRRVTDPEKLRLGIYDAFAHLYTANPPQNIGKWWLEKATESKNIQFGEEYFVRAFWTLNNESGNQDLSLEYIEKWVDIHSEYRKIYESVRTCSLDDWQYEHAKERKEWASKHKNEELERHKYFKEQIVKIKNGDAYPQVFHHLSAVYFNHYTSAQGKTGEERLSEYLLNDEDLIYAAKCGLRKVVYRNDLPEISDIFALAIKSREHYIRLPFLTGLTELYNDDPTIIDSLNDDLTTKALAFWYTYGAGNEPAWVKPLSLRKPELTSKIYVEYVSAMLNAKMEFIHGLYQLANEVEYREIAKLVGVDLMEIYPVRSAKGQLSALEYLIKIGIKYLFKPTMLKIIEDKLLLKSMDVAQRVYWITAGLLLDPSVYENVVRKYVSGNVIRINHLSNFLYSGLSSREQSYNFHPSTIGLIIELLGGRCSPNWPERSGGFVTRSMNEGDFVRGLINRLSENTDTKIPEIINHLLSLSQLEQWHEYLKTALQTQRINTREALFKYPGVHEVAQSISNLNPANVSDLAALTIEHLKALEVELRASNTDSYKRLWNVDGFNKLTSPRPENSCRDYLVEKLRPVLSKIDVDVQPETHEHNDKRADMRLSFFAQNEPYFLPVEIKLNSSPDLWRAIHEQLIPLYTLTPETQGRGLFIVFWFGSNNTPAPPGGKKPNSVEELKLKLMESLSPKEKTLIDIFVLDVARQDH